MTMDSESTEGRRALSQGKTTYSIALWPLWTAANVSRDIRVSVTESKTHWMSSNHNTS